MFSAIRWMASRETSGSFTSFTCLQIRRRFLVMALDDSKDHVDWWTVGRPVDWLATSVWSWMSWTSHCTSRAATDYMTASSDHRLHVNRLSVLHIASSEMIGPLSTRIRVRSMQVDAWWSCIQHFHSAGFGHALRWQIWSVGTERRRPISFWFGLRIESLTSI